MLVYMASDEDDALPLLLLRYLLETFCMKDGKPPADQSELVVSLYFCIFSAHTGDQFSLEIQLLIF